jgi:hypothetical protein
VIRKPSPVSILAALEVVETPGPNFPISSRWVQRAQSDHDASARCTSLHGIKPQIIHFEPGVS